MSKILCMYNNELLENCYNQSIQISQKEKPVLTKEKLNLTQFKQTIFLY